MPLHTTLLPPAFQRTACYSVPQYLSALPPKRGFRATLPLAASAAPQWAQASGLEASKKVDRARGLIIHGPAHRGANSAAMPTDENDQDGHFFYNHPERGGYFAV